MSVTALIPAFNCADRIAATVTAAARVAGVSRVIVVDDGSADDTGRQAELAGATVVRHDRNLGKGAALRTAAAALGKAEVALLLDADLAETAAEAAKLLPPVVSGEAQMAIATFPRTARGGGFGLAVRTARLLIRLLTGETMQAPLSGQRALAADLVRQVRFADRFAVEVALTLDALLLGAVVVEVPTEFAHKVTGWSARHVWHRFRQLLDVWRAALPRLVYPFDAAGRPGPTRRALVSAGLLAAICAGLLAVGADWAAQLAWWLLLGLYSTVLGWWLNRWLGLERPNYQGQAIPAAMGLGLLLCLAALGGLHLVDRPATPLLAGLGFGALGLLDDRWGDRAVGGLAGHLGALRRGKVTTGLVKLVGGTALALIIGWQLSGQWLPALVDGALIALAANTVNLLDLRPGRALKAWLLLALPAALVEPAVRPLLGGLGVAAALYAPLDLGGKAMLGDTGANALGAVAGLALALSLGLPWKVLAVALLLGLHVLSEFRSLGRLIESNPDLAWLDRLGRRDIP